MILPTPTTTTIEVCYIPQDVRSRYRAIWCKGTDFRTYQFNLTGHCTRSGCFVVDLVQPVSDLPSDLPTTASAGLVEVLMWQRMVRARTGDMPLRSSSNAVRAYQSPRLSESARVRQVCKPVSTEFWNSRTSPHTLQVPWLTGPLGVSMTQWCAHTMNSSSFVWYASDGIVPRYTQS